MNIKEKWSMTAHALESSKISSKQKNKDLLKLLNVLELNADWMWPLHYHNELSNIIQSNDESTIVAPRPVLSK